MYVILEGIDTSGKTTQIQYLKPLLPHALFTQEPGGTEIGVALKDIIISHQLAPATELFLFLADRAEHFHKVIAPNKERLIISDRGLVSGIAYAAHSFLFSFLQESNALALHNYMPDLVILLEIDRQTLKKRLSQKKQDNIELRGIEYLLHVQEQMHNICTKLHLKIHTVNATQCATNITKEILSTIIQENS